MKYFIIIVFFITAFYIKSDFKAPEKIRAVASFEKKSNLSLDDNYCSFLISKLFDTDFSMKQKLDPVSIRMAREHFLFFLNNGGIDNIVFRDSSLEEYIGFLEALQFKYLTKHKSIFDSNNHLRISDKNLQKLRKMAFNIINGKKLYLNSSSDLIYKTLLIIYGEEFNLKSLFKSSTELKIFKRAVILNIAERGLKSVYMYGGKTDTLFKNKIHDFFDSRPGKILSEIFFNLPSIVYHFPLMFHSKTKIKLSPTLLNKILRDGLNKKNYKQILNIANSQRDKAKQLRIRGQIKFELLKYYYSHSASIIITYMLIYNVLNDEERAKITDSIDSLDKDSKQLEEDLARDKDIIDSNSNILNIECFSLKACLSETEIDTNNSRSSIIQNCIKSYGLHENLKCKI